MRHLILCFVSTSFLIVATAAEGRTEAVTSVATAPSFFNPSAEQQATISFEVARPGRLLVTLLDRDRVRVRQLADEEVAPGTQRLTWDGRDEAGTIVPDEAYTVRIELSHAGRTEVYDPSAGFVPALANPANPGAAEYSRVRGTLSYRLTRPSRVHIQAGQGRLNPTTGESEGPILKTLLDRVPRVAGAVVESWNGLDESGTIYVPDLPDFAVAVLAASLPESSIIAVGNRRQSFVEHARLRPSPLSTSPPHRAVPAERHHAGLTALEDRSPRLELEVEEAFGSARRTAPGKRSLVITARLSPEDATHFLIQPTHLLVFVDDRLVLERKRPRNRTRVTLPPQRLTSGPHRVVVNWASEHGPVAVGVARVLVAAAAGEEDAR